MIFYRQQVHYSCLKGFLNMKSKYDITITQELGQGRQLCNMNKADIL